MNLDPPGLAAIEARDRMEIASRIMAALLCSERMMNACEVIADATDKDKIQVLSHSAVECADALLAELAKPQQNQTTQ